METVKRHDARQRHYLRAMDIDVWHLKSVSDLASPPTSVLPAWSGYVAQEKATARLLLLVAGDGQSPLSEAEVALLTRMSAAMNCSVSWDACVGLSEMIDNDRYAGVVLLGQVHSPDSALGQVLSLKGVSVPIMVTDALSTMLEKPQAKALVWKHLQQTMTWLVR